MGAGPLSVVLKAALASKLLLQLLANALQGHRWTGCCRDSGREIDRGLPRIAAATRPTCVRLPVWASGVRPAQLLHAVFQQEGHRLVLAHRPLLGVGEAGALRGSKGQGERELRARGGRLLAWWPQSMPGGCTLLVGHTLAATAGTALGPPCGPSGWSRHWHPWRWSGPLGRGKQLQPGSQAGSQAGRQGGCVLLTCQCC